jgi:hypothetical protein
MNTKVQGGVVGIFRKQKKSKESHFKKCATIDLQIQEQKDGVQNIRNTHVIFQNILLCFFYF